MKFLSTYLMNLYFYRLLNSLGRLVVDDIFIIKI